MPGPSLIPRTGVFYISAVSQLSSTSYRFIGKYEDYTGFSSPTDVSAGWVVYPNVYWNGYEIAGLYARYVLTARTVITGTNNIQFDATWDAEQNDTPDAFYPIAGTSCALCAVTPQFKFGIPTPYKDASANGVRLPYDAIPAIQNLDKVAIMDDNWGATGPTGPVGLGAFSVGE